MSGPLKFEYKFEKSLFEARFVPLTFNFNYCIIQVDEGGRTLKSMLNKISFAFWRRWRNQVTDAGSGNALLSNQTSAWPAWPFVTTILVGFVAIAGAISILAATQEIWVTVVIGGLFTLFLAVYALRSQARHNASRQEVSRGEVPQTAPRGNMRSVTNGGYGWVLVGVIVLALIGYGVYRTTTSTPPPSTQAISAITEDLEVYPERIIITKQLSEPQFKPDYHLVFGREALVGYEVFAADGKTKLIEVPRDFKGYGDLPDMPEGYRLKVMDNDPVDQVGIRISYTLIPQRAEPTSNQMMVPPPAVVEPPSVPPPPEVSSPDTTTKL